MERNEALGHYAQAWTEQGESGIRAALERCWTPLSTYTDPMTDTVTGIEEFTKVIVGFPELFPGASLEPTSLPDIHHEVGRFTWLMRLPRPVTVDGVDYGPETEGMDYVEFDTTNRISRVVGFFGPFVAPT
jgi:hypothetical protein